MVSQCHKKKAELGMVSSLKQQCDGLSLQIVVPHGFTARMYVLESHKSNYTSEMENLVFEA